MHKHTFTHKHANSFSISQQNPRIRDINYPNMRPNILMHTYKCTYLTHTVQLTRPNKQTHIVLNDLFAAPLKLMNNTTVSGELFASHK